MNGLTLDAEIVELNYPVMNLWSWILFASIVIKTKRRVENLVNSEILSLEQELQQARLEYVQLIEQEKYIDPAYVEAHTFRIIAQNARINAIRGELAYKCGH